MKKYLVVQMLAFVLVAAPLSGQDKPAKDEPSKTKVPAYELYSKKSAVAFNAGAMGLGLEYAQNFHPKLNGRLKVNVLPYSLSDYKYKFDGNPTIINAEVDFLNIDLLVEFLPFTRSSFKLVGGLGYFANGNISALVNYDGTFTYGEIELSESEVGNIEIGFDYSGIAPYLGFGFGRAVPRRRVGFGFELGAYYTGGPMVDINATGVLTPTASENIDRLQENMDGYAFLPHIKLRLAVRLN